MTLLLIFKISLILDGWEYFNWSNSLFDVILSINFDISSNLINLLTKALTTISLQHTITVSNKEWVLGIFFSNFIIGYLDILTLLSFKLLSCLPSLFPSHWGPFSRLKAYTKLRKSPTQSDVKSTSFSQLIFVPFWTTFGDHFGIILMRWEIRNRFSSGRGENWKTFVFVCIYNVFWRSGLSKRDPFPSTCDLFGCFFAFFSTLFLVFIFRRKWPQKRPLKIGHSSGVGPWGTPGGSLEAPQRTRSRKSMKMTSQIDDFQGPD